jgi:tetraacyldisaccharide 4'-kinase
MNPLTGLYGAGMALRNALFDRGVLPALRLEQPVVSVGNLSAGGAGKTPFVIALGELLKERGIRFDVLSRGYRRKTRGVLVVDPDRSASDFGDEPILIARKLGVPVVVGESRYEAGRVAEQSFQTQLHLLDDGFQHRSLARDFDIVLMVPEDFNDRLLPSGRLREPLSSLRRADAIVLPQGLATEPSALREKPVWRMTREIHITGSELTSSSREGTVSAREGTVSAREGTASAVPLARPPSAGFSPGGLLSPVVFCGLARPQQFFAQVRAAGVTPSAEVVFRDHHAYDQRDIQRLLTMRSELGAGGFLTTEKDLINLGPLQTGLETLAVAALKLTLDRPADLVDTILARIGERKPRS